MKTLRNLASIITAAAIITSVSEQARAAALQDMQSALVYLQKARMTAAVQQKNASLKNAKEQLIKATYDRGGHRTAAITLVMQATAKTNEFKLDQANQLIDMAIVKVKHAIQAMKQEASAKKKGSTYKK